MENRDPIGLLSAIPQTRSGCLTIKHSRLSHQTTRRRSYQPIGITNSFELPLGKVGHSQVVYSVGVFIRATLMMAQMPRATAAIIGALQKRAVRRITRLRSMVSQCLCQNRVSAVTMSTAMSFLLNIRNRHSPCLCRRHRPTTILVIEIAIDCLGRPNEDPYALRSSALREQACCLHGRAAIVPGDD